MTKILRILTLLLGLMFVLAFGNGLLNPQAAAIGEVVPTAILLAYAARLQIKSVA